MVRIEGLEKLLAVLGKGKKGKKLGKNALDFTSILLAMIENARKFQGSLKEIKGGTSGKEISDKLVAEKLIRALEKGIESPKAFGVSGARKIDEMELAKKELLKLLGKGSDAVSGDKKESEAPIGEGKRAQEYKVSLKFSAVVEKGKKSEFLVAKKTGASKKNKVKIPKGENRIFRDENSRKPLQRETKGLGEGKGKKMELESVSTVQEVKDSFSAKGEKKEKIKMELKEGKEEHKGRFFSQLKVSKITKENPVSKRKAEMIPGRKEVNSLVHDKSPHNAGGKEEVVEASSLPSRIVEVAKELQGKGVEKSRLILKLHPPELGKVKIELRVKGNELKMRFEMETQHGRHFVEGSFHNFKHIVENEGFILSEFVVLGGSGWMGREEGSFREAQRGGSVKGSGFGGVVEEMEEGEDAGVFKGRINIKA